MCGVLALLFLAVPALEIAVILQVGSLLGLWPTLAIIAVTAVIGAWLTRHQGFAAVRQIQHSLMTGSQIGASLVNGALILAAGVLMLTPGFVTDAVGFALLIPPSRHAIARQLRGTLERRIARGDVRVFGGGPGFEPRRPPHGRDDGRDDRGDGAPPIIDV
jgi:UPF0716 protein FxsA